MIVVPDRRRSLGRQIRRSVRADRGDEAKALLLDDSLHVDVRIPTDPLPSCRPPLNQGSKRSIRGARGVFTWMLQRLADAALVNGQTVGIDEKAEGADPRDARALTSARNLGRMNS
jgi:hypothetical protein